MSRIGLSGADQAFNGIRWQMLSILFGVISTTTFIATISRLVNPESFGQLALFNAMLAISQIVSQFGFGPFLVYRGEMSSQKTHAFMTLAFGVALVCGFAIALLSPLIVYILDYKLAIIMILLLALQVIITALGAPSRYLLIRQFKFKQLFFIDAYAYAFGLLPVGIGLALSGQTIWALLLAYFASALITTIGTLWFQRFRWQLPKTEDINEAFRYCKQLTTMQLTNQFGFHVDKFVLASVGQLAMIGNYERAQRLQQLPQQLMANSLNNVLFSTLSKKSSDTAWLRSFVPIFLVLVGAIASVPVFYLALYSTQIVSIALGDQWELTAKFLTLMCPILLFQLLAQFSDTVVRSTGKFSGAILIKVSFIVSLIMFGYIGYSLFDFLGVIVGFLIGNFIHCAAMVLLSLRIVGTPFLSAIRTALPIIILLCLFISKNVIIYWLFQGNAWLAIPPQIITDLFLLAILLIYPRLIGRQTVFFIKDRLNEITSLQWLSHRLNKRLS